MIDPEAFHEAITRSGILSFFGVPDSLLKEFCAYLQDEEKNHVIAANEGNAVALAAGHYLGTGQPSAVYLQNSGLGNAVNPLVSLIDPAVYDIPVLLIIGWRGEPDADDEPQHIAQGSITTKLLETIGIPYIVVDENQTAQSLGDAIRKGLAETKQFALVVKKGVFSSYVRKSRTKPAGTLNKEHAIDKILNRFGDSARIVSTTGKISRELFEIRENRHEDHSSDFLSVGSMGHASQIAAGLAISRPDIQVICFDGDGSALMHLGGLFIAGGKKLTNFLYVLFNNGAHDSVGGQPTVAGDIDWVKLADSAGFKTTASCSTLDDLESALIRIEKTKESSFIEVRVRLGSRENLGRPSISPVDSLKLFRSRI